MQTQYKIYKIDENAIDITLPLLDNYKCEKISDSIIAIQYDYLQNGYKELLEKMSELRVSQYIFTSSVFYTLLSYFVDNGLNIYEIKLNILFKEDNDDLTKFIRLINQKRDVEKALGSLLEILKWYNYDEGIDINHMTFGIKCDEQYCRFHFYNNGILAVDSDKVIVPLLSLLKNVM